MLQKKFSALYQGLLTIIMIMVLFLFSFLILTRQTITSSDYLINTADKVKYYDETTTQINQAIQDLGMASGINKDGLKNAISSEQVEKDFTQFIQHSFSGDGYKTDEKPIKDSVRKAIDNYAKKENKVIDQNNKQSIEFFLDKSYEIYDSNIRLPLVPTIGLKAERFRHQIFKLLGILGIIFIVLLILLYFASHKHKHVLLRFLAYANLSTGFLYIFLAIILKFFNPINRIGLSQKNLFDLVTSFINGMLPMTVGIMLIFIVVGLILAFVSIRIRSNLIDKSERREREREESFDMFYEQNRMAKGKNGR